jgi:hypothetical protein
MGRRFLHVFDLAKRCWRKQRPEEVSAVRGFYSLEDAREMASEEIEEGFIGRIESAAAPIVKRILRREFPLSGEGKDHLIAYVALAYLRTRPQRESVARRAHEMGRAFTECLAADPKRFDDLNAQASADGVAVGKLSYDDLRRALDEDAITYDLAHDLHVLLMVDAWRTVIDSFAERQWSILVVDDPLSGMLVTSDDPVSIYRKVRRSESPAVFRGPITSRESGLWMPLGPYTAVVGDHDFGPTIRRIDAEEVARINGATVLPGRSVVFSPTRYFRWWDEHSRKIRYPNELPEIAESRRSEARKIENELNEEYVARFAAIAQARFDELFDGGKAGSRQV